MAFRNNLFVPYQNPRKFGLSINEKSLPDPWLLTITNRSPAKVIVYFFWHIPAEQWVGGISYRAGKRTPVRQGDQGMVAEYRDGLPAEPVPDGMADVDFRLENTPCDALGPDRVLPGPRKADMRCYPFPCSGITMSMSLCSFSQRLAEFRAMTVPPLLTQRVISLMPVGLILL